MGTFYNPPVNNLFGEALRLFDRHSGLFVLFLLCLGMALRLAGLWALKNSIYPVVA